MCHKYQSNDTNIPAQCRKDLCNAYVLPTQFLISSCTLLEKEVSYLFRNMLCLVHELLLKSEVDNVNIFHCVINDIEISGQISRAVF